MKRDNKTGLHWYTAGWHFGSIAHAHNASPSHNQSGLKNASGLDTDWYVKGLQLGTSTNLDSENSSLTSLGTQTRRAIAHIWQAIAAFLSVSDDPRLWQTKSASGDILWNAYDPKTNCHAEGLTEQDMRIWLEERYAR